MDAELRRGPAVETERPAEWTEYEDSETGVTVTRLTDTPGGNWHLYFTENGWYDGGRRLLIRSDRTGSQQLHSIDLETGTITQLTDLSHSILGATRAGERALFWCDDRLAALNLDSLEVRELYERPEGYSGSHAAGTADGERAVVAVSADVEFDREFESRGEWIEARMDAGPRSEVISVPIDGGGEPTVHVEDDRWLNHVNASPTRPELVTYCEEGPWEAVDRIRVLDLESGEQWRVRPTDDGEAVGHEYWLADGEYVGYHGWRGPRDDPEAFFGRVRYDGNDRREWSAPDLYTHVHSNGDGRVVCDGTHRGAPFDLLWEHRGEDSGDGGSEEYAGPWKLARHGWESDSDAHPHSRLSPDDSRVVFDASEDGTDAGSDVYLIEIPDDPTGLPRFDLEGFEPATDR